MLRARSSAAVLMFLMSASACFKAATPMGLTAEGALVRVSDDRAVDGCEYIGDFAPSIPGPRQAPNPWAANQVRNVAAESGATDVVFDPQARGAPAGKGYRCEGRRASR